MVDETHLLLDLWRDGMTGTDLYRATLESGRFPTLSARRLHDLIVVGFAQRYLVDNGAPARILSRLKANLSKAEFEQLLFLYTCRAHAILSDFVGTVYWGAYSAGQVELGNDESRRFVEQAVREGKTTTPWSDHMVRRVASYLTGCCADYGMLERGDRRVRKILPFRIEPRVVAFLAYDLHFKGHGDNSVLSHPDWGLFGLARADVLDELKRLALKGVLIVQAAGDVTRISWPYKNMEELADVLAHSDLR